MKFYFFIFYFLIIENISANPFLVNGIPIFPPSPMNSTGQMHRPYFGQNNMIDPRLQAMREDEFRVINDESLSRAFISNTSNNIFNNVDCESNNIDLLVVEGHVLLKSSPGSENKPISIKCDYMHFLPNSSLATTSKLNIKINKRSSGNIFLKIITDPFIINSSSLSKRWKNTNQNNFLKKINGHSAESIKFSTNHVSPLMTLTIHARGGMGSAGGDGGDGGLVDIKLPETFHKNNLIIHNQGGASGMSGVNGSKDQGSPGIKGSIRINENLNTSHEIVNPKDLMD